MYTVRSVMSKDLILFEGLQRKENENEIECVFADIIVINHYYTVFAL
jgi:hypothetical protein